MGEKSDSKKVSSPYVVLENRTLDQWKVTELKEELKKRKLMTSGLKEVLVKRLDEAVRAEIDDAKKNLDEDLNNEAPSDDATPVPVVTEDTTKPLDNTLDKNEGLEKDIKESDKEKDGNTEGESGIVSAQVESLEVVQEISVKTTVIATEVTVTEEFSGQEPSQVVENNGDSKPEKEQADVSNQVDEVSQIISDSIPVDTISNTEKNDPKDNVTTDDVKSEVDVKPEMVMDSSKSEAVDTDDVTVADVKSEQDTEPEKVIDEGKSETVEVNDPLKDKIPDESGDVCSSEKLNLDRSSGDDSMEEDVQESKQIESKLTSNDTIEKVKEGDSVDAMVVDKISAPVVDENNPSLTSTKRKPHTAENSEVVKRQRRWNSEGLKVVPEQQLTNNSAVTTPKDTIQKRIFSRSESKLDQESPKERIVPPSLKTPTTSLRIDNFLRPFTLKAVQELLGKTGTVASFWMDNIKTHCYVTYESVEEAVETRNAVCNLQWPVNGGRLLMADFVDPIEVKKRVDPPPPPPVTAVQPPQPSPRLNIQKQQQLAPPPSMQSPRVQIQKQQQQQLPPPPVREVVAVAAPPPPPPPQVEAPIVTLDDLFRKTRATPRIYYLPLTDEQVAEKMKTIKQSAGVAFWKELFQQRWPTRSWWWFGQRKTFTQQFQFGFGTFFIEGFSFIGFIYVSYVFVSLVSTSLHFHHNGLFLVFWIGNTSDRFMLVCLLVFVSWDTHFWSPFDNL